LGLNLLTLSLTGIIGRIELGSETLDKSRSFGDATDDNDVRIKVLMNTEKEEEENKKKKLNERRKKKKIRRSWLTRRISTSHLAIAESNDLTRLTGGEEELE
jgi:hypothetical protein